MNLQKHLSLIFEMARINNGTICKDVLRDYRRAEATYFSTPRRVARALDHTQANSPANLQV
jgi:hypothetical protein